MLDSNQHQSAADCGKPMSYSSLFDNLGNNGTDTVEIADYEISFDSIDFYQGETMAEGLHADSAADGLVMSLNTLGRVDIDFISKITGLTMRQVIADLRGSIYQNPKKWNGSISEGWETADEYLSGNLVEKLKDALLENSVRGGYFDDNIRALREVQPPVVSFKNIYVTLGTPWLPTDIVEGFIRYLLGVRISPYITFVFYDDVLGEWEIRNKSQIAAWSDYTRNNVTYGTSRINALNIIEKTLNMQQVSVGEVQEKIGLLGKILHRRVVNEKDTLLALEKQEKIRQEFAQWLNSRTDIQKRIEDIYIEKYACIRARKFDGSFLSFPNINQGVLLYPYQKNAVARILFSPNVLLAHEVGAGKTYIMTAAGMELRRLNISQKNMYVVPNNIVDQWVSIFKSLYAKANILAIQPKNFTVQKRQKVLKDIRDNDYDAIIIAYSCFEMIPVSDAYIVEDYKKRIVALNEAIKKKGCKTALDKACERLTKEYNEFLENMKSSNKGVAFDELNINTLFVDEAHNFKNVPFKTKGENILGINSTGSVKCKAMFEKVKIVQKQNNGRGVIFATGTPITNSISDLYIIQQYLQSGTLATMELGHFDAWIGNFAELATGFEIDVDSTGYRMARRFSKFHNLPELTSILAMIADFHGVANVEALPIFNGYTDTVTSKQHELAKYIRHLSSRADDVRAGRVLMKDDNMLKITTDGRKAALDVRLVDEKAKFSYENKIYSCAKNVKDIYTRYYAEGGTQVVFCDTSTPKKEFNAYDELKLRLIILGVLPSEIAYIHEATSDAKREEIFEKVRKSEIRVLIGSTWKMGMGVNIQDHLVALHHLDVPWRPADMVQREGRIMRPGNMSERIYIYRYITEGTFDAYSWQILETKQRFINKLLAGSVSIRTSTDIGDTVLSYAEVKALAIGNPIIKERVETMNELSRYYILQARAEELRNELSAQIDLMPSLIEKKNGEIEKCKNDIAYYNENQEEFTREELKAVGHEILHGLINNEFEVNEREICTYKGFRIILPAGMQKDKPYIYVEREGRYKLECRFTDIGIMIRIDNLLNGLDDILSKLEEARLKLESKLNGYKRELLNQEDYTDRIIDAKNRVKQLDKKLGVGNND